MRKPDIVLPIILGLLLFALVGTAARVMSADALKACEQRHSALVCNLALNR